MKIQILGDDKPKKKFVEIKKVLDTNGQMVDGRTDSYIKPYYITLLCLGYNYRDDDLFLIHSTKNPSDDAGKTILCLGKWNDGVWPE